MSILCSWNVRHASSRRLVSFLVVCEDIDKAGWIVMAALPGIDKIGLPEELITIQEGLHIRPGLIAVITDVDIAAEIPAASRFLNCVEA